MTKILSVTRTGNQNEILILTDDGVLQKYNLSTETWVQVKPPQDWKKPS